VWTLVPHHPVHALHAMDAFLAHFRTLTNVKTAKFATFLQKYAYGQQQYADCANSKRQE
jgi:hypothetical protein